MLSPSRSCSAAARLWYLSELPRVHGGCRPAPAERVCGELQASCRDHKPATTCDALISFIDVTPTFIDLAGGEPPQGLDGKSFCAVLAGQEKSFHDAIYASHTRDGDMNIFPQRCVRDARYKYILNLTPEATWTTHWTKVAGIRESHKEVWDTWVEKAKTDAHAARIVRLNEYHPQEELYDTQTGPYEFNNLANDPAAQPILLRLRQRLAEWLADQGETTPSVSNP